MADSNGGTLEQLMRSLASMTSTGDLSGGDTLAGGGAAKGGNRMLGFLLSATAGAPRTLPARRGIVSGDKRREVAAGGAPVSLMTMTSSSSLVVGYVPAATMRSAYSLLRLCSRVCCVDARAAIARMAASIISVRG